MMTRLTRLLFIILIALFTMGQASFSEHPHDATLKCKKDKILVYRIFEDKKFDFEKQKEVNYGEKVSYLYVSDEEAVAEKNEIVEKRTKNVQFFKEDGKNKADVYAGEHFYLDDSSKKWYLTATAFMKRNAFEAQTSISLWDELNRWIAYADSAGVYSGAGDGRVEHYHADWDTAHDALTGTSFDYTTNNEELGTKIWWSVYDIAKGFFPFLTEALPDCIVVSAATLRIYNNTASTMCYFGVVQTSQPDCTVLTTADFDLCGDINNPDEGATRLQMVTTGNKTWTLNDIAYDWIEESTGAGEHTRLGVRDSYDLDDDSETCGAWNTFITSELGGTANTPKLSVTYEECGSTTTTTVSARRIMDIY